MKEKLRFLPLDVHAETIAVAIDTKRNFKHAKVAAKSCNRVRCRGMNLVV